MILTLSWRNIWRNPRRTAITLAAISLNAAILIVSYALMDGIMEHTVSNATNMVVGEAQIHVPKYLVNRSLYKSLKDPEAILSALGREHIPAAPRSYGYGLVAHETKSAGALFWGVDPAREKTTFDLAGHVATYEPELIVLAQGGLGKGGFNFDAKPRRGSLDPIDLFYAHISGMDAFARGLLAAQQIMDDGLLDNFIEERYASYSEGIGKQIMSGEATFESLEGLIMEKGEPSLKSGRQEMLESIFMSYF